MTESQWQASRDPQAMLTFLRSRGGFSPRKARLFACACCRRIWPLLEFQEGRKAVEVGERFADGVDQVWIMLCQSSRSGAISV